MGNSTLLDVQHLNVSFPLRVATVNAVNDVSFTVQQGDVLGIVGESGSGKSTLGLALTRLLSWPGKITGGKILFEGRDIVTASDQEMRRLRGAEISTIFQDPVQSLNPVFTIGDQIVEQLVTHKKMTKPEAVEEALSVMRKVGIPEPQRRFKHYPHEFSGGMRQRVMIAIAICCKPKLVIADEPTTALDVTIQAQILDLLRKLKEEMGMSVILISHNLGVVAELSRNIAVMYAGRIVEYADVASIFESPKHPYTKGLLGSTPNLETPRGGRLNAIPGAVPDMMNLPAGCPFTPRCEHRMKICSVKHPEKIAINEKEYVLCHLYD